MDAHQYYKNCMDEIMKVLAGGVDEKENDFNVRNSLLMEYKMIDADLNLLFKGKVAASCNDIILTEFFFSGLISQITNTELLALLSVFCTNEKGGSAKDCIKQYSESFTKALDFVYDETEKLIELEKAKGIAAEGEDTVEKRLNLKFYEMVYDWAD